jgi:hypothetical protein
VDLSSPPHAKSSSFVTATLPSVFEFIAIEPPHRHRNPFGPSQSISPIYDPKAPSPSKPPPPNPTVREFIDIEPTAIDTPSYR